MRVLLIDVNYKHSSTGKIVHDLYTSLNDDGHIAGVCYGRGKNYTKGNIFKFGIDIETFFHAFMTRITGLTGFFSIFSTYRLIRFIEKFKPDVVHIHELHAYFVNLAPVINYLKKRNIKTVWTFHCEFMYTGKCGHAYECENWRTECHKCPQLREYPKSILFDFTKYMYRQKKRLMTNFENLTIVTPSKWLETRVLESFLKENSVSTIYNGINTEQIFFPRDTIHIKNKLKISSDYKVALTVGANIMADAKGGGAFVSLARRFTNSNVKFILVGALDQNINYGENVLNLGVISDQNELAELYSLADIFILTSEKETFSLVCIESLACGTPIIGYDSGAPTEIVTMGYGEFVRYGDIDSLEEKLASFLDGRTVFNSEEACVALSRNKYSKQSMYSAYLKYYFNG